MTPLGVWPSQLCLVLTSALVAATDAAATVEAATAAKVDDILLRTRRAGRLSTTSVPEHVIRQRIQTNVAKRAMRRSWACPACAARLGRLDTLRSHLEACCPDLFDTDLFSQQVRRAWCARAAHTRARTSQPRA